MALIDGVDSYYSAIVAQMAVIDPSQVFNGYAQATDWPGTPPNVTGGLYLLVLTSLPIGGTEAQILYRHACQWVWIIIGTDIQANEQAANRGDRFRQNFVIESNLRQANYPGFCQKKTYSADSEGNVTSQPVQSVYPVSNVESVWWSRPRFMPKQDQSSGLVYGAAAVDVFAYDDVAVAIA